MDALTASELPALDRWILTLHAMRADPVTLIIPGSLQLSLSEQADLAGCNRSTVTRHLSALERAGWLVRDRPSVRDQRRYHARTAYTLTVPGASGTPHPSLGAPGAGLDADGHEPRRGLRRRLGALRGTRQTDRQSSTDEGNPWDDDGLVQLARGLLAAHAPAVTTDQARAAVRSITEGRDIRHSAAGYIRRSIGEDPRRYLPTVLPPPRPGLRPRDQRIDPARLADITAETRAHLARAREGTQ